jgi:anaerobic magnesium-protoporphyrin IX monomethyl ester cyclase
VKILISHSYYLNLDSKEAAFRKPYPPLASITLAGWIKQELGMDVEFYDVMFDKDESGLSQTIEKSQPDIFVLYDDDFNFLTKMCLENMRNAVLKMMKNIPKKGMFIAHSSDASDQAEIYLRAGFDVVVHRNAEKIIVDILRSLQDGGDTNSIRALDGISYIENGQYVQKPQNTKNFELERAPSPRWDLIDVTPYREMWVSNHGYFSLNVSTSHGCPYNCNWCAKPLYGRTYKVIPAKNIAREFHYLKHELDVNHVWMTDDIFGLKPGWMSEFVEELERLDAKIPFKCQNRADLINADSSVLLKRCGCDEVWMGVESGSQKILDAMDKGETIDSIKNANRLLKQNGIKVGFFLQYGYLGEGYADIRKTLQLVRECLPDYIGISVSYPLKDTPFYDKVVSQMGEKKNWADSGDLALMYHGKYHPDFYRALYHFTHHYFGFFSLFKKQPIIKKMRRIAAQSRHIPGMIKYRSQMNKYILN